jgi:type I restriction enzyme R subunit
VPLKFQRQGITYAELPEDEKEAWDAIEWTDDGDIPDQVSAGAINQWLFNEDTVDKVLGYLMTHGLHVAGGDRLGKTIIFARNHDHAQYIAERFDASYPHHQGRFARVIDFKTEYAQSLIDDFSTPEKVPHIAISVDMLDTGIDIPEVVNLVFFKLVRSKTKFWQMLGRGTRLCPDLFGPDQHKEFFSVFDFCQNFEFFNQNPVLADGSISASLSQRLFAARVEVLSQIDAQEEENVDLQALRADVATRLREEVQAMNPDNVIVRPKRRLIEKYHQADIWHNLGREERTELTQQVAGLPSALEDSDTDAKQFDLLVLKAQLALLERSTRFERYRQRITETAALLEELQNVPMVASELALLLDIQTDTFWQGITPAMLESVRQRVRGLVNLLDVKQRPHVYTNFEDEIGAGAEVELKDIPAGVDMQRFRMKVRHFLDEHMGHIVIQKIRRNDPLTAQDLAELERIFLQTGAAEAETLEHLRQQGGLGLFIRSLAGLDRQAAKHAFAAFIAKHNPTADQTEFLNMIIDHLTEQGVMEPDRLYESPFTDRHPQGVDGLFAEAEVIELIDILKDVRKRAAA